MHRTTVVFDEIIWKKLRRMAADQGLSISKLLSKLFNMLLLSSKQEKKQTKFNWIPKDMGKLKIDLTSRREIYELSDRFQYPNIRSK